MILAGHQPNYLPYLGFFHKIYHCDIFVIVDNVQFVKRGPFGWINRNKIRTPDGWQWLTVPVLVKGKFHQKIMETEINQTLPWGRKHWRSLEANYRKSKYFVEYAPFFEETYQSQERWKYLSDLSSHIILFMMKALGIEKPVKKASELGAQGKGDELILDMCRKVEADSYLHGKHGADYIDEGKFNEQKVKCLYQEFQPPVYEQQFEPFIADLSAIDLLFNHGPESLQILRGSGNIR
ncbi:MAG: WbqC family protein [Candidatus Omnitrophica bacterium]|nr:WbqC family protein [Candidatus Omnitrophota bacterium]